MADDVAKTGKGWLATVANWASYVPLLGVPITLVAGGIDTLIESTGWLLRGKPISALTAYTSGTVSTMTNAASSAMLGVPNLLAAGTGRTMGTHARGLTENVVGGAFGIVGLRPTVTSSHVAGMGSLASRSPGQWATRVSQQAGRNPDQQWAEYIRAQQQAQVGMQRG